MVSMGGTERVALPAGSCVQFRTILGSNVRGSVVLFDPSVKILAIRDVSGPGGKPVLRMFNMNMITDITEIPGAELDTSVEELIASWSYNPQQVQDRNNLIKAKTKAAQAELMEADVSLDGQKAFIQLRRILEDGVRWDGKNIRILGCVLVSEPYTHLNATATKSDEQSQLALNQVKKILQKPFVPEQRVTSCLHSSNAQ